MTPWRPYLGGVTPDPPFPVSLEPSRLQLLAERVKGTHALIGNRLPAGVPVNRRVGEAELTIRGDRSLTGSLVLTSIAESDDTLEDADRLTDPRACVSGGEFDDI